nr:hypothetical protein [Geodermatophilus chilensis]
MRTSRSRTPAAAVTSSPASSTPAARPAGPTDRLKDMIISGGENVYSVEVESVLAQHPAVATCAVIGIPDETWGERVHAVVVPAAGAAVTLDELRAFCADRLAGYKTPRSTDVVDALPLSPVGKVLKRELRKPSWAGQKRAVH